MQYYLALPKLKNMLEMSPHSKSHRKRKKNQIISWSELIFEDRNLKSLADGRSVLRACQYHKF